MNTQYLRYAVEVEKTRSITKAAQNLFMGQPNLSKAIRQLEREVGITIFNRTAKGVEVTRKGAEFLSYASTILSQIDELESLYKPHPDGCIRMSLAVPRSSYITDAFCRFLNTLDPTLAMAIDFQEADAMTILHNLGDGSTDLGILRCQTLSEEYFRSCFRDMKLHAELLWQYSLQILLPEDHPLAELSEIPYHRLGGCIEIVHGDSRESPVALSEISPGAEMPGSSRKIYIYERGSQFDLLKQVKNSFMWVPPIPQQMLAQKGMVTRPCSTTAILNKDFILYPKGHILRQEEQDFLQTVRQTIRDNFSLSH